MLASIWSVTFETSMTEPLRVRFTIATCAFGETVTATSAVIDDAAKAPDSADCAVTVTTAVPADTAVMTPVALTVAIAGALVP